MLTEHLKPFNKFLNPILTQLGMPSDHIKDLLTAPHSSHSFILGQLSFSKLPEHEFEKAHKYFAFINESHKKPWPFYIKIDDFETNESIKNVTLIFPCEEGDLFFINIQRRSKTEFIVRCQGTPTNTVYLPFSPSTIKVPAHSWFLDDNIFTPKMRKLLLLLTDKALTLPKTK